MKLCKNSLIFPVFCVEFSPIGKYLPICPDFPVGVGSLRNYMVTATCNEHI